MNDECVGFMHSVRRPANELLRPTIRNRPRERLSCSSPFYTGPRGDSLACKTGFQPLLEDKALMAIVPVSGSHEILPTVGESNGIRGLCIHLNKLIRNFLPF